VTRTLKMMSAALILFTTVQLAAQSGQPPAGVPNRPAPPAPVSLKVSLVFSRYQGDKKISSVPHTLWVTANDNRTSLRMGTQIPVTTSVVNKEGEKTQSYNYRDVGTNIDCSANSTSDGAYKLTITIEDSSVYFPEQSDAAVKSATAATGAPAFRNFHSTFPVVLRDGQTAQMTSATDPVSGQVVKLDATLNVQK
jgi:type II secretory pathway component GspD/PulD (secretin)